MGRFSISVRALWIVFFVMSAFRSAEASETIEHESTLGPVHVHLILSPSQPVIGDVVELELVVEALPGVEILMPEFGEALGRFEIVDFAPSEEENDSGSTVARQKYRLQPAHSGSQTIPPLRIEFMDRRPGQVAAPMGEDAFEILTERITLEVAPILGPDVPLELRPRHRDLGPRRRESVPSWAWAAGGLLVTVALGPFAWRYFVAARERRRRQSAYEVARSELDRLLLSGRPNTETMDAFYVKLSLIVRSYLEDRFGLRSPELTTQEFLTEMGRSPDLARSHRRLLQGFLEEADLVKFAGHRPGPEVVAESISAAEQFLTETRDFVSTTVPLQAGSAEASRV
ncbi:MAG: hypothetical protein H8E78_04440 [Proteobacteria bacterium]|nr:hypothetical protein [Pseudomonadota bacterium]